MPKLNHRGQATRPPATAPSTDAAFWQLPGLLACVVNKQGCVITASDEFTQKFQPPQASMPLADIFLQQGLTSEDYARLSESLAEVLAKARNFGGDTIYFENPYEIFGLYSTPAGKNHLIQLQSFTYSHQITHERTLLDHLLNLTTPVAVADNEGVMIKRNRAFNSQFNGTDNLLHMMSLDLEQLRQITPMHHQYWHEKTLGDQQYNIQLGAYPDAIGDTLYYLVLHNVTDKVMALRAEREAALGKLRQDLAHHLHDRVAQYLAFMQMKCTTWVDDTPTPQGMKSLRQALQAALTETRLIINHLRQGTDASASHPLTLQDVLTQARDMMGLVVTTKGEDLFTSLDMATQLLLCTILFEALSNARRHAGTDRVWITCETAPHGIHLHVKDNGRGFDTAMLPDQPNQGHFGLRTIQDRLRSLGGTLVIDSQPHKGTRLTVYIPLNPQGDHAS